MHVFKVTCFALLAMTIHAAPGLQHDAGALVRRQNEVLPDLPDQNEGVPGAAGWEPPRKDYPADFWRQSRYKPHPYDPDYPFIEEPSQEFPPKLRSKANIYNRCIDREWRTWVG